MSFVSETQVDGAAPFSRIGAARREAAAEPQDEAPPMGLTRRRRSIVIKYTAPPIERSPLPSTLPPALGAQKFLASLSFPGSADRKRGAAASANSSSGGVVATPQEDSGTRPEQLRRFVAASTSEACRSYFEACLQYALKREEEEQASRRRSAASSATNQPSPTASYGNTDVGAVAPALTPAAAKPSDAAGVTSSAATEAILVRAVQRMQTPSSTTFCWVQSPPQPGRPVRSVLGLTTVICKLHGMSTGAPADAPSDAGVATSSSGGAAPGDVPGSADWLGMEDAESIHYRKLRQAYRLNKLHDASWMTMSNYAFLLREDGSGTDGRDDAIGGDAPDGSAGSGALSAGRDPRDGLADVDAYFLDDSPHLLIADARCTTIRLSSFACTLISHDAADVKAQHQRDRDRSFYQKHPDLAALGLNLHVIRRTKVLMLSLVTDRASEVDLSTVAFATCYFERLIMSLKVNHNTATPVAAACVLLSVKFNESGVTTGAMSRKVNFVLQHLSDVLQVPRKRVLAAEWHVYVALKFRLAADPAIAMQHVVRYLTAFNLTPLEYFSRQQVTTATTTLSPPRRLRRRGSHSAATNDGPLLRVASGGGAGSDALAGDGGDGDND